MAWEEYYVPEPSVYSNEVQDVVLAKTFHCLAFLLHPNKVPKDPRYHRDYHGDLDDRVRSKDGVESLI